jgi:hypothetical protein
MRENRTCGSEGGEPGDRDSPTPIQRTTRIWGSEFTNGSDRLKRLCRRKKEETAGLTRPFPARCCIRVFRVRLAANAVMKNYRFFFLAAFFFTAFFLTAFFLTAFFLTAFFLAAFFFVFFLATVNPPTEPTCGLPCRWVPGLLIWRDCPQPGKSDLSTLTGQCSDCCFFVTKFVLSENRNRHSTLR